MSKSRINRRSITPGRAGRAAARLAAVSAPPADGSSWYRITNKADETCEVMIYDEIGYWGITAKHFDEDLAKVTAKTITLRINSPGGNVFDGFAIYSALRAHAATVNVHIDGVAASIASVIAMAGDTVTIAKRAFVMIHDPSSYAFGNASDLRKEAELLDKIRDQIAGTYADRCGGEVEDIKKKMAEETWFDSESAMEFGLVDAVAGDDDEDQEDSADLARTAAKVAMFSDKLPEPLKRVASAIASPPPPVAPKPLSTPKTETPMALKISLKDGKQFVNINGTEHEVEGSQPAPQPSNQATGPTAADVSKAATDAVAAERAYRRDFTTAVAASGMDAKTAGDFETKFYGRPIEDVKFLASNAIGARASAVGEGSSEQPAGGKDKGKDEDPEKSVTDAATKRFDTEPGVRQMFGAQHAAKGTDQYKAAQARYVEGELKQFRDNAPANRAKLISGAA